MDILNQIIDYNKYEIDDILDAYNKLGKEKRFLVYLHCKEFDYDIFDTMALLNMNMMETLFVFYNIQREMDKKNEVVTYAEMLDQISLTLGIELVYEIDEKNNIYFINPWDDIDINWDDDGDHLDDDDDDF
jgi:hypothetical protein